MDDVTDVLLHYRETVRHLWNTAFLPTYNEEHPFLFGGIEYRLFYALIVYPLGFLTFQTGVSGDFPFGHGVDGTCAGEDGFGIDPIPFLSVIPHHSPTPVHWLTETEREVVSTEGQIDAATIDLRFIDFDDYRNEHDPLTLRYYKARVITYPADPAKKGTNVLIEVNDARVLFEPVEGAVMMDLPSDEGAE